MPVAKTPLGSAMRPNPALVISIIALVVAVMGSAVATASVAKTAAKNSVTAKSIKNGTIKTKDISSATLTDLNDAATVGGLSVAQLVAAAGGEYVEAHQAAGSPSIEVLPVNAVTVATLNIPHAGKWLVNATVPVTCSYDGSDGAQPNNPAPDQPNFPSQGKLLVGGTVVETQDQTCEAEAGAVAVIVPIRTGTATIHFSRMITTTGATTVTLKASGAASNVLGVDVVPGNRINATASNSLIQGVTVH
jgi:hypothetical protein